MIRAVIAAAVVAAPAGSTAAETPIVVPIEDVRTHAVVARWAVHLTTWTERINDQTAENSDATATWFQVGLGPRRFPGPFEVRGLDRWSARLRFGGIVHDATDKLSIGPVTTAVQRIDSHDTLSILPMIHLQTGVEIAIATPWLADRGEAPGLAMATVHGPDAELARHGWSIRPATAHIRADLLLCRSWFVELALGSEVFRPTDDRTSGVEWGLRWHAAAGLGLGCNHHANRWNNALALVFQYRARAMLYSRDADESYADTISTALEWNPGRVALALFGAIPWKADYDDHPMIGLRVSVGLWGNGR